MTEVGLDPMLVIHTRKRSTMTSDSPITNATCWTLIHAVHEGDQDARNDFVRRYLPPVRAYLKARWGSGPLRTECEDATQEVFVRCFSKGGPLQHIGENQEGGFRAFLYGMTRNVARELESDHRRRRNEGGDQLDEQPNNEARHSAVFDRQFARQVMKEARARFEIRMRAEGSDALARLQVLSMRFEENLPVRKIAAKVNRDPAVVHKQYARARADFRQALLQVIADQDPQKSQTQVEATAEELVELLGSSG